MACMALHGAAWHCMVLHGVAWHCMVLHGVAWHCMALHGTAWRAWHCMALHGAAWHCMALHVTLGQRQQGFERVTRCQVAGTRLPLRGAHRGAQSVCVLGQRKRGEAG